MIKLNKNEVKEIRTLIQENKISKISFFDTCLSSEKRATYRCREEYRNFVMLMEDLKKNTSIKAIDISYFDIKQEELVLFCDMLKQRPDITSLILCHNEENMIDFSPLAKVLPKLKNLKVLDVAHCDMGDEEVSEIIKGALSNEKLESLILSRNYLAQNSAEALKNSLPYAKGLKNLEIDRTDFTDEELEIVAQGIEKAPSLTTIKAETEASRFESLSHAISQNKNIIEVVSSDAFGKGPETAAAHNKKELYSLIDKVLTEENISSDEKNFLETASSALFSILKKDYGFGSDRIQDFFENFELYKTNLNTMHQKILFDRKRQAFCSEK
ncbi:MAG: hypothetical protein EOM53_00160 [Alphaproteobacteria bacterium]|nr:hypothetical protein [Alphaproteobacteria bacterium]